MSSPELSRRIDRHEDDLRVVSDTVLDIKETVDGLAEVQQQHTAELTEIKRSVVGHTADLAELKTSVAEILTLLRRNG